VPHTNLFVWDLGDWILLILTICKAKGVFQRAISKRNPHHSPGRPRLQSHTSGACVGHPIFVFHEQNWDNGLYGPPANQTASTGSIVNPFTYTAREFDSETGLMYYRARYYDQSNGRFLSEDPIRFLGGKNYYLYAKNNPVLFSDPQGLIVIDPTRFPAGSAADVILALQDLQKSLAYNAECDCYFRQHGGRTLTNLINDPNIFVYFNPNQEYQPSGPVHGKTYPRSNPNSLWLYPAATSLGEFDIEWTIVHELLHLNGDLDEKDAEEAAAKCAIPIFRTKAK